VWLRSVVIADYGSGNVRVEEAFASMRSAPFIAVEVASTEAVSAQPRPASGIEIRNRRGWSLVVEAGFDASHLRRLLAILEMAS
jgi:hypothetical protein